jgi:tetratricopeptide (TPR) repeat protein
MTTPATPSDPQSAELPPSPEVNLQRAWDKYATLVYIVIAVVAAGILAKGGWDCLNVQKELGIKKDFAEATTPDALKTFVANHPGHVLTGVAELSIGNSAYATGKFTDALAAYNSAASDLPAGPFQANAKMGAAMSLLQTGKSGEAEAALHSLLNDASLLKTTRCEAGYHLAVIAVAAGRSEDYQKLADQVMALDPSNPYAEHTFSLKPPANPISLPGAIVPAKS